MIVDSNIKIAVTCDKCGEINIEELNMFEINKGKEIKYICSCGSLNCMVYSDEKKDLNISTNCIYCGKDHKKILSVKDLILGIKILCPEVRLPIVKIGDMREIKSYIKDMDKDMIEALYDKSFETFFHNHDIMKQSLEKLRVLKEDGKINCDCGNEDIALEIYPERIELRCSKCQSVKIIYAENQGDLDTLYEKKKISMKQFEFEFIDAANNSDHK